MERHAHRRLLTLHGATANRAQDGRHAAKSSAHLPQLSQLHQKRHAATEPRAASLQGKVPSKFQVQEPQPSLQENRCSP